jgi:hypothetical protein
VLVIAVHLVVGRVKVLLTIGESTMVNLLVLVGRVCKQIGDERRLICTSETTTKNLTLGSHSMHKSVSFFDVADTHSSSFTSSGAQVAAAFLVMSVSSTAIPM